MDYLFKPRSIETDEQAERLVTQRVENASTRIAELRPQIDDVAEQAKIAKKVLERTTIRSPVDGIVVQRGVNIRGLVVEPGRTLVEILPTNNELVVEARIDLADVDNVHIGQPARLRFSGLNARVTPDFPGKITYISADRLMSEDGLTAYYVARLKIDSETLEHESLSKVAPGMPVESFIATDERTFFEYLTKPLMDSVGRAFREE